MNPLTPPVVLAADAVIDLQMHTIFSDGTWTPEQLIDYLVSEQFGLGAITDHDRVDACGGETASTADCRGNEYVVERRAN